MGIDWQRMTGNTFLETFGNIMREGRESAQFLTEQVKNKIKDEN